MNDVFLVFGYGVPKNILRDENYNFLVVSIDFDVSANRYLPIEYLVKKEGAEL